MNGRIEELMGQLRDEDPDVRKAIQEALEKIRKR